MTVKLSLIRDIMLPGLHFMGHSHETLLLSEVPERFFHLRKCFGYLRIKEVGDLHKYVKYIRFEDAEYRTDRVKIGREYPQGWGRGPGGWRAEPPPEPDGKVDVFQDQDNENMKALKAEIEAFCEEKGYYKP